MTFRFNTPALVINFNQIVINTTAITLGDNGALTQQHWRIASNTTDIKTTPQNCY